MAYSRKLWRFSARPTRPTTMASPINSSAPNQRVDAEPPSASAPPEAQVHGELQVHIAKALAPAVARSARWKRLPSQNSSAQVNARGPAPSTGLRGENRLPMLASTPSHAANAVSATDSTSREWNSRPPRSATAPAAAGGATSSASEDMELHFRITHRRTEQQRAQQQHVVQCPASARVRHCARAVPAHSTAQRRRGCRPAAPPARCARSSP